MTKRGTLTKMRYSSGKSFQLCALHHTDNIEKNGAPGATRTPDPQIRSLMAWCYIFSYNSIITLLSTVPLFYFLEAVRPAVCLDTHSKRGTLFI